MRCRLTGSEYEGCNARVAQRLNLELSMTHALIAHQHDPAVQPGGSKPALICGAERDIDARTSNDDAGTLQDVGEET